MIYNCTFVFFRIVVRMCQTNVFHSAHAAVAYRPLLTTVHTSPIQHKRAKEMHKGAGLTIDALVWS